jgi:hypothetical protein
MSKIILDGIQIKKASELEDRLAQYRTGHLELDIVQGRAGPMELGNVSESQDKVASLEKQVNELCALIRQNPPQQSSGSKGGSGNGAWSGYGKGYSGTTSTKGKGKGKDGKGGGKGYDNRRALDIAHRRAKQNGGQVLCPSEAKYGKCTWQEHSGKPCKFMHVKNLPPQIAAVEGLVSSDLKGLQLNYDPTSNVYMCAPCKDDTNLASVAAAVESEAVAIAQEIENEGEFQVYDNTGSSAQGFPGHS